MTQLRLAGLAIGLALASVALPSHAETARDLGLTVTQATVYDMSAPARPQTGRALNVTAWVDHENNTYHTGEAVRLFVKTNKDSYITVINVGPTGNTTVLFPNQFQADNLVRAGQVQEIPSPSSPVKITVSGPVGSELIKVIASTKTQHVFQQTQLQPAGPWQVVAMDVNNWSRDLALTMAGQAAVTTTTHVVETGEWDTYNKVIRTVPGPGHSASGQGPMTVVWSHSVTAPGPVPVTIALPKPTYAVGETIPIQVVSPMACQLTVSDGNNNVIYPMGGQAVLVPANTPVVVNGVAASAASMFIATCQPVMEASRDAAATLQQSATTGATITYSIQ